MKFQFLHDAPRPILVLVVLLFAVSLVVGACGKSDTAPVATPVPAPVQSTATCTVRNLPRGTPPICRDASGIDVRCPDNFQSLPDCPQ